MTQPRHPMYSEQGVAPVASAIPTHAFNPSGVGQTATLDFIIGEMRREPGKYIKHFEHPRPPINVFGIK